MFDAIDKGTFYSTARAIPPSSSTATDALGKGEYRSIRYKEFEKAFIRLIEIVVLTPNGVDNSLYMKQPSPTSTSGL